jgi:4-amino-4-deoxy-L-arabinose transferase-like glycosyltransferase
VLVVLLTVAAFLRFTQLNAAPPGMTHDEAAYGAEAERVLAGERPLYFALGYGHEPLYAYAVALAFSFLGRTLWAMRATSAVCGILVVLGTYLLTRRLFGVRSAQIAAAYVAVSFWPLSISRQALRAVTLPMFWLPAAWFFWRGMEGAGFRFQVAGFKSKVARQTRDAQPSTWNLLTSNLPNWLLSGLLLGASFYTYLASRTAWVVFPVLALYMLLQRDTRARLRRVGPGILIALAVAGLVALPMVLYLHAHPAIEVRMNSMMGPIRELLQGRPRRVLTHFWNALRVFSWVGDPFWAYNIPGRPVFDLLGSALFYIGLLAALWRWRDPRRAFLILWLAFGMAPAAVTTNEGIFWRAIIAQPAACVLLAEGVGVTGAALRALGKKVRVSGSRFQVSGGELQTPYSCRVLRWGNIIGRIAILALVVWEGARSYQAYFVDWPARPETRNIFNHNMATQARYLAGHLDGSAVGISALYPLYYHDPWILRYVSGGDTPGVRWFDGRGGIVYPAAGEARYLFSALTPLHPALWADFSAQAALVERRELSGARGEDQNPYFEVWRWSGQEELAARLAALQAHSPMWVSPEVEFTQPETRRELDEARFGAPAAVSGGPVLSLIAYRLNGRTREPGDVIELITYWRALRTVPEQDNWTSFVHLLDRDSRLLGGVDVWHCPPTGWQPGDVVVQVHAFHVAGDAPPGEAFLEGGLYRRIDPHTMPRLPVLLDGEVAGDRVLLSPIQISGE